ncbi:hypothetical protein C7212DRAFT_349067 [Tuber magnatum]|uniref:Uncharacterized protein n=1 Tax=Tuber magnatum TaxID=42249 RepID=A0A317SIT9_9PEZI|nr:hypothetical protein C7212DRAFT_349067 [Tuber magnatum]
MNIWICKSAIQNTCNLSFPPTNAWFTLLMQRCFELSLVVTGNHPVLRESLPSARFSTQSVAESFSHRCEKHKAQNVHTDSERWLKVILLRRPIRKQFFGMYLERPARFPSVGPFISERQSKMELSDKALTHCAQLAPIRTRLKLTNAPNRRCQTVPAGNATPVRIAIDTSGANYTIGEWQERHARCSDTPTIAYAWLPALQITRCRRSNYPYE